MRTPEELDEVVAAIDEADPNQDDEELQGMRNALRFAAGYEGDSAKAFINMYVAEA